LQSCFRLYPKEHCAEEAILVLEAVVQASFLCSTPTHLASPCTFLLLQKQMSCSILLENSFMLTIGYELFFVAGHLCSVIESAHAVV
jgi:hypothetical protein